MKKVKIVREPKRAVVTWEDACVLTGRSLANVIKCEPFLVETTGHVFKSKGYVNIRAHMGDLSPEVISNDDDDFMKVPKTLVRKIVYLKSE